MLFKTFSKDKGLLSNTIYDIKVVKNGLLYIAHDRGLSSFDGTKFINYANISNPFKSVNNILEAPNGEIWCKGFDNIYYKLVGDKLVMRQRVGGAATPHYSAMIGHTIVGIFADSVYFFDTKKETTRTSSIFTARLKKEIGPILFTQRYLGNNKNLLVFVDADLNVATEFLPAQRFEVLHNFIGNKKILLQENAKNLNLYNYPSLQSIPLAATLKNAFINNIVQLDSVYFICTTAGVYRLNANNQRLDASPILENYNVSFAQKDRENNYWFSTLDDGLVLIPSFKIAALNGLPQGITAMAGQGNKILLGTKQGRVWAYDLQKKQPAQIGQSTQQKAVDIVFESAAMQSVIYSSNKTYFNQKGRVTNSDYIIKDYSAVGTDYLLGCNYFLFYYGHQISKIPWLQQIAIKEKTTNIYKINTVTERVSQVCFDEARQAIFYSNPNGLFMLDSAHTTPLKILAGNYSINDLALWQGQLLVATKERGLCLVRNGRLQNFEFAPTKTISSLANKIYIYQNELWVLAADGLHRKSKNNYQKYDAAIGLPVANITDIFVDSHQVYANTKNEILIFDKKNDAATNTIATLTIGNILVNNRITPLRDLQKLPYKQNNIELNFSLLAFNSPTTSWAEYTLNGAGPFRVEYPLRSLKLSSLRSGPYTLIIYPVTNGEANMASKRQIQFSIAPPFWQRAWFMSLLAVIFFLVVYAVVEKILRRKEAENKLIQSKLTLEKELDKSMLTSIKAQMNPHFLFNALNTIQSYIYSNDKQNASIYISKFSDLTRAILAMSSAEEISLEEEIQALKLYLSLEKMRFEESFYYYVTIDSNLNKEAIRLPSMLVQPYVENAIKHGLLHKKNNRVLKLSFVKKEMMLEISIEDNGIGRVKSGELNDLKNRKHPSFAMEANKKRLDILKNANAKINLHIHDIMSDAGQPVGTKVVIRLPLTLSHNE